MLKKWAEIQENSVEKLQLSGPTVAQIMYLFFI